jgi:hypothetical protein
MVLCQFPRLGSTTEPTRVTLVSEDFWQVPGASAGSTTIRYSLDFGREVWRNARLLKDEWIEQDIRTASRMYKVVYIDLGIQGPDQTTFSQVLAAVERLKRLAAKSAERACKLEIVVGIRNPIKFESPAPKSSACGAGVPPGSGTGLPSSASRR